MLTIFTPTYNRGSYLRKCYDSLKKQSFTDFEWLIIDDGSTDDTQSIIQSFIEEGRVNIRYIYQNNSGKQAAWNNAVLNAKGQYFIGVDSDDALVDDSLSLFFNQYIPILEANNDCVGIRALSKSSSQAESYDRGFLSDENYAICSWFDEFSSRIVQERIDILKTELLKDFLYPVSKHIKFIPEVWFYVRLSQQYKFLYVSECLRVFYDDHNQNRLSRSSIKKNAHGHFISRLAMLRGIPLHCYAKNPIAFIKTLVRLVQSKIYLLLEKDK